MDKYHVYSERYGIHLALQAYAHSYENIATISTYASSTATYIDNEFAAVDIREFIWIS